ncbi:PEP-CTERM sorting domain-containing protein [Aquabacterium sp. OR-4]|uniref:PEP-CTERM sorting domain-containing protein n=1 Tax=Aquabacterium sp. OR-4 TaxID=2978127 RepID=UPI0021B20853|nr:PEP-CTERM sorting domain-containing protein [Aquabacterium sp. OR-4]MDT7838830.1 PEP-CTERM sorting domain-containing protein [Aquabacterium sp. OR-4]
MQTRTSTTTTAASITATTTALAASATGRLAAGLATLLIATTAPALAADSTASLQVTQLQFSTTPGLTLSWLDSLAFQSAFAESREAGGLGGNSLQEPAALAAWADQALHTSTPHAAASAGLTAAGSTSLAASATRFTVQPLLSQPHTGQAWAQQAAGFTLSGAGQVTITVDYSLSVAAPLADDGHTWALAALTLNAGNLDTGLTLTEERSLGSATLPGGSGQSSGRISFVIDLENPQQAGWFDLRGNVDVSAAAAVPEPQTWALFALGLGTLLLAARRRQRG